MTNLTGNLQKEKFHMEDLHNTICCILYVLLYLKSPYLVRLTRKNEITFIIFLQEKDKKELYAEAVYGISVLTETKIVFSHITSQIIRNSSVEFRHS